jgi:truncated hemoglobin YjbI
VQLHGAPLDDFTRSLRAVGAQVVEVPVYRTVPPQDDDELERLVKQVLAGEVQAVTFTSAAAVSNLLDAATRRQCLDDLLDAFQKVLPVCVGKVAAAPLERLSVPTLQPEQSRIGALVHTLTSALPDSAVHVRAAGHELEVRATGAVVDGTFRPLPPAPMAMLHALAAQPGRVLSLAALKSALPGGGDDHAVEVAIGRLRTGLGDARCIRNVVKRGYLLTADVRRDEGDEPPDAAAPPEEVAPLLDSIGGRQAVREAVERLYARLLADPLVSHYFHHVEMPRLKRHQVLLLTQLLGGPARFAGRALAEAHAGLHITSAEYRCVMDHLSAVLRELCVAEADVTAIRAALDALESAVVAR